MNPSNLLYLLTIQKAMQLYDVYLPEGVSLTEENAEELHAELGEDVKWADALQDAKSEIRGGDVETGIKCPCSRHYESKAVASQLPGGRWVGWTYWYGGGKHGEPGAIDWIEDAYLLDCVETQEVVTVRKFTVTPV